MYLGECGFTSSEGKCYQDTTTPTQTPIQNPFFNRSRKCSGSLKWPPPGRRPGLRSLSLNPQQPPNRLLGSRKGKQPRVSIPRSLKHQTTDRVAPHSKAHITTREYFWYPRSLPHPKMCGGDSSALHVHFLPPHRGSPPAGCLEERYSLPGRIWQHTFSGPYGIKPCALPAVMLTECAAESLSWSTFSSSTVSKFVF